MATKEKHKKRSRYPYRNRIPFALFMEHERRGHLRRLGQKYGQGRGGLIGLIKRIVSGIKNNRKKGNKNERESN